MKKILLSSFMTLLVYCAIGQNIETDMDQLRKLNATFINNFVTSDTVSHSKIIHRDFVCITGSGSLLGRRDYLQGWTEGFKGITYWDYRDEDIKIFGNVALVHAQNKYIAEAEGKEITGMSMYTDIYLKENNEWKCIQAQITRLTPENYAGDETIVKKYDYRGN
jgi:ketosteroid isomerase-like protein